MPPGIADIYLQMMAAQVGVEAEITEDIQRVLGRPAYPYRQ